MRLIRVIFINMKRHIKNPLMWAISFLFFFPYILLQLIIKLYLSKVNIDVFRLLTMSECFAMI